jgi:hypothetical protein
MIRRFDMVVIVLIVILLAAVFVHKHVIEKLDGRVYSLEHPRR